MNENNYCSLEMSKKLVDAGIMLETDVYGKLTPSSGGVIRRRGIAWNDRL